MRVAIGSLRPGIGTVAGLMFTPEARIGKRGGERGGERCMLACRMRN